MRAPRHSRPLVGAVAIACWYGGIGPGAVAIAIGFPAAWFIVTVPGGSWHDAQDERCAPMDSPRSSCR